MNREQMAREVIEVLIDEGFGGEDELEVAGRILDAILPQVTTVEELEALPSDALLMSELGHFGRTHDWLYWKQAARASRVATCCGPTPLTVVWQP
jgi:hypothetical protein